MRPSVGLVPTMRHIVGADGAHQATKRASMDEHIRTHGDRRWVAMQTIILEVHHHVAQRAIGLGLGLSGR